MLPTSKRAMALPLVTALSIVAAQHCAHAAGFQLKEQSAASQGNAFAGATARAQDLSTIYFNPAGMTRLKGSQADTNFSYIMPSAKLKLTTTSNPTAGAATALGTGTGGDAGVSALVPAFYGMYEINPDLKLGISINTPFGLSTKYDDGWAGRYFALKSEIKTINVAPSIAYRVNNNLSLGGAVEIEYIDATLTKAVTDVGSTNIANDGKSSLLGDDIGFGGRLGLLYEFNDATRLGFSYQSRIKHNLKGKVKLEGVSAATKGAIAGAGKQNVTHSASAKFITPDIFSLGLSHDINDQWTFLADASRTQWTVFKKLQVLDSNGTEDENIYENWKASHFVSLGADYKYDAHSVFRGGIAFDQKAVETEQRTARIPDSDRLWLSLGYGYKQDNFDLNVGFSHIITKDANLHEESTSTTGSVTGVYDSHVNILAVNATWKF